MNSVPIELNGMCRLANTQKVKIQKFKIWERASILNSFFYRRFTCEESGGLNTDGENQHLS